MTMNPLAELGRRMRELAQSLGCDMDNFVVLPDLDGNTHVCQVMFVLPELEPLPQLDGIDVDAEAERLLGSLEDYEVEAADQDAIDEPEAQ